MNGLKNIASLKRYSKKYIAFSFYFMIRVRYSKLEHQCFCTEHLKL